MTRKIWVSEKCCGLQSIRLLQQATLPGYVLPANQPPGYVLPAKPPPGFMFSPQSRLRVIFSPRNAFLQHWDGSPLERRVMTPRPSFARFPRSPFSLMTSKVAQSPSVGRSRRTPRCITQLKLHSSLDLRIGPNHQNTRIRLPVSSN
jgi:hypothetical protein